MIQRLKILIFAASTIILLPALGHPASAQDREEEPNAGLTHGREHRHYRSELLLGACAGQLLEQQGISLPAPHPHASMDPATEAAFQSAIQSCRSQQTGATPQPSVSPEQSGMPQPSETPQPGGTVQPTETLQPGPSIAPAPAETGTQPNPTGS